MVMATGRLAHDHPIIKFDRLQKEIETSRAVTFKTDFKN
jgi:hypothetical protein